MLVTKPSEIALSFAGEQRSIAEKIKDVLEAQSISVFYDNDKKSDFVGKYGVDYFIEVYTKAVMCVPLLSKEYYIKAWPGMVERSAIETRLMENMQKSNDEQLDFIMPFVVDDSRPQGLLSTLCPEYEKNPEKIAELILVKYARLKSQIKNLNIPKINDAVIFIDWLGKYFLSRYRPLGFEVSIGGNEFRSSIIIKTEKDAYELRFSDSKFAGNSKAVRLDAYLAAKKDYTLSLDILFDGIDAFVINLGGLKDARATNKTSVRDLVKQIMQRVIENLNMEQK